MGLAWTKGYTIDFYSGFWKKQCHETFTKTSTTLYTRVCENYDLCGACEMQPDKHDQRHAFIKLKQPGIRLVFSQTMRQLFSRVGVVPNSSSPNDHLFLFCKPTHDNKLYWNVDWIKVVVMLNWTDNFSCCQKMMRELQNVQIGNTVHSGIRCDNCSEKPIKGVRYRCWWVKPTKQRYR